jgi:hypothetical protein
MGWLRADGFDLDHGVPGRGKRRERLQSPVATATLVGGDGERVPPGGLGFGDLNSRTRRQNGE